jgi:hypothetical protein
MEGGANMKRKLFSPSLLVLGCVLVTFAGCETLPSWAGGSRDTVGEESLAEVPMVESVFPPAAAARFDDVPVPEAMKMEHERSFVFQSESLEVGFLIYEGRLTPEDAAQFFVDSLPRAGWALLDVIEYNDITIKFDQPEKNLIIHISPKFRGCVAKIILTPKTVAK